MLLMSFFLVVSAHDIEVNGLYYNFTSDTTVSVTYKKIFGANDDIKGKIVIPSNINYNGKDYKVTSIESNAFYFCRFMESVSTPATVAKIERYAFTKCTSLTSVVIPDGVKDVEGAFVSCVKLKSLTIPASVNKIGEGLVFNCHRLEEIVCKSLIPPVIADGAFDGLRKNQKIQLKVSKEVVDIYKNTEGWNNFEIIGEL